MTTPLVRADAFFENHLAGFGFNLNDRERIIRHLALTLVEVQKETLEKVETCLEDFGWELPMYQSSEVNRATDDAACAVQEQIKAAVHQLIQEWPNHA